MSGRVKARRGQLRRGVRASMKEARSRAPGRGRPALEVLPGPWQGLGVCSECDGGAEEGQYLGFNRHPLKALLKIDFGGGGKN